MIVSIPSKISRLKTAMDIQINILRYIKNYKSKKNILGKISAKKYQLKKENKKY